MLKLFDSLKGNQIIIYVETSGAQIIGEFDLMESIIVLLLLLLIVLSLHVLFRVSLCMIFIARWYIVLSLIHI